MALLTVTEVRTHVETGLVDAALTRIMNAAEQDIDQRHGAVAAQVDDQPGGLKSIWTTRPILTITSVVETVGSDDTTLSTDDDVKRHETQLDRLDADTRELIILCFYSQASFKEIAAMRSEPIGTTLSKLHRGLKKLRELME